MNSIQADENNVVDDDISMPDCSINGEASAGVSEVENSLSNQAEICFGTVSLLR